MKKTRFNELHKKLGGKMIEFCGWEHARRIRGHHPRAHGRAGPRPASFDVSHMGEVLVTGKDALAFVQWLTPNDAGKLVPGQVQYTALMTPESTFVDDMLVYCMGPEEYFLVVNAANDDKDFAWIAGHTKGFDVKVEHQSDVYSQLALQGPLAETDPPAADRHRPGRDEVLPLRQGQGRRQGMPRLPDGLHGRGRLRDLHDRTRIPASSGTTLIETGKPLGLQPIGLGARDTLRLEAKLLLYGNDIDDKTTVARGRPQVDRQARKGRFPGQARHREAADERG